MDRDHPKNIMEMKSTATNPRPPTPPPPYRPTMPYPRPPPSSYGYPDPTTSGTPNHPAACPTSEINFGGVHTVEPNYEPSSMVVVIKREEPYPKIQCCMSSAVFILISIVIVTTIITIVMIVRKIMRD